MFENRFLLVDENPNLFRPEFYNWLKFNTHVYEEFERRALHVAKFRKHYSARTILETIRHDTAIAELNGEWKLNNNFTPCLARLFALSHPDHKELFEYRVLHVNAKVAA